MKLSLFSLLSLLIASPLAAQTVTEYHVQVGQPVTYLVTPVDANSDFARIRIGGASDPTIPDVPVALFTNVTATEPFGLAVFATKGFTKRGTFLVSGCIIQVDDLGTLNSETCSSHTIRMVVDRAKPGEPKFTVIISTSGAGTSSTTSGPSGTTTTTTAPK